MHAFVRPMQSLVGGRADAMQGLFEQFDTAIKQIGTNLETKTRLSGSDANDIKGLIRYVSTACEQERQVVQADSQWDLPCTCWSQTHHSNLSCHVPNNAIASCCCCLQPDHCIRGGCGMEAAHSRRQEAPDSHSLGSSSLSSNCQETIAPAACGFFQLHDPRLPRPG